MAKQEQAEKPKISRRHEGPPVHAQPNRAVMEKGKELKGKTDHLVDEIDRVLDEVKQSGLTAKTYVQKGGE